MAILKNGFFKSLGPGLLWAGAAIGVSHLIQSTRAGAHYGYSLVWVVILVNVLKYPFFEYGPRYAAATGESLIEGYKRLGNWAILTFAIITFGTMFIVEAAVTIVTASIATQLFGFDLTLAHWSAILLTSCVLILVWGRYPLLDKLMKVVIVVLAVTTVTALITAIYQSETKQINIETGFVWDAMGISFLIALMGWMPSAIDISVWNSLWTIERKKQTGHSPKLHESLLDFNIGYIGTALLSLVFLSLGSIVMYGAGESFSDSGIIFAKQLVRLYSENLGNWSKPIILIAAFTTMFSTTLTCTDAFPRVWSRIHKNLLPASKTKERDVYWIFMALLVSGALVILYFFTGGMTLMVDVAATISFLTAPILGFMNYKVITGDNVPFEAIPPKWLKFLNWLGLVFLSGFALLFLMVKIIY